MRWLVFFPYLCSSQGPDGELYGDLTVRTMDDRFWSLGQGYNWPDKRAHFDNVVEPANINGCMDNVRKRRDTETWEEFDKFQLQNRTRRSWTESGTYIEDIDKCSAIVGLVNEVAFDYMSAETQSASFDKIGLTASMDLALMGGDLELGAMGHFMRDEFDNDQTSMVIFTLIFRSGIKSFDQQRVIGPSSDKYDMMVATGATHYVKDISYGGYWHGVLMFDKSEEGVSNILKLAANFKYNPGAFAVAGGASVGISEVENSGISNMKMNIIGFPAPIFTPTTLDEFFAYLADFENFISNFHPDITSDMISSNEEAANLKGLVGVPFEINLGDIREYNPSGDITTQLMALPKKEQTNSVIDMVNDLKVAKSKMTLFQAEIDEFARLTHQRAPLQVLDLLIACMVETQVLIFDNINSVDLRAQTVSLLPAMEAYNNRSATYPCREGINRFGRQFFQIIKDIRVCFNDFRQGDNPQCSGHGTCLVELDDSENCIATRFRCQCDPGWSGDRCQYHICDDHVATDAVGPCRNNPIACTAVTITTGYRCQCAKPFTGQNCTIGYCETEMRDGSIGPCENGAICENLYQYPFFKCKCNQIASKAWSGKYCSIHVCDSDDPCNGNGRCVKTGENDDGFRCECFTGYHSDNGDCSVSYCDRDPITGSPTPCGERGTCVIDSKTERGYKCDCAASRRGDNCELHATCSYDPEDEQYPCKNGGTCVEIDAAPYFRCNCPDNYLGYTCTEGICTSTLYRQEQDFCGYRGCEALSEPLSDVTQIFPNFGENTSKKLRDYYGTGFVCGACKENWWGDNCEHNVCDYPDQNPCKFTDGLETQITGKCKPYLLERGYQCECIDGFFGPNCETSVCDGFQANGEAFNPCYTGDCVPSHAAPYGFYCKNCENGYYGDYCEKHVCSNKEDPVCKHGGMCLPDGDDPFGFKCECILGTTGRTCEEEADLNTIGLDQYRMVSQDHVVTIEEIDNMIPAGDLIFGYQNVLHHSGYKIHDRLNRSDIAVPRVCAQPSKNSMWEFDDSLDAWYLNVYSKSMTRDAAKQYCEYNGGSLVSIGSKEEFFFVTSYIQTTTWIGLKQSSTGKWSYDDGCKAKDQTGLTTAKTGRKCAMIKNRKIETVDCSEKSTFVCKKPCSDTSCKGMKNTGGYINALTDNDGDTGLKITPTQYVKFEIFGESRAFLEADMHHLGALGCEHKLHDELPFGWFKGHCSQDCSKYNFIKYNNCGNSYGPHLSLVSICAAFGKSGDFYLYSHDSSLSWTTTGNGDTCINEFAKNAKSFVLFEHIEKNKVVTFAEGDHLDAVVISYNADVAQQERDVRDKRLTIDGCRYIPKKSINNFAYFWCNSFTEKELVLRFEELEIKEVMGYDFSYKL